MLKSGGGARFVGRSVVEHLLWEELWLCGGGACVLGRAVVELWWGTFCGKSCD